MRVQFKANPPITITEARKLLGDEAEDMTDIQIQELIDDFDIMAQYVIKMVQKFKDSDNAKEVKR